MESERKAVSSQEIWIKNTEFPDIFLVESGAGPMRASIEITRDVQPAPPAAVAPTWHELRRRILEQGHKLELKDAVLLGAWAYLLALGAPGAGEPFGTSEINMVLGELRIESFRRKNPRINTHDLSANPWMHSVADESTRFQLRPEGVAKAKKLLETLGFGPAA